jgi:hypothetical protein
MNPRRVNTDVNPQRPIIEVVIKLHPDGGLSVEGPLHDKLFMLAMIDNARDAVKNHGIKPILVPSHDVRV